VSSRHTSQGATTEPSPPPRHGPDAHVAREPCADAPCRQRAGERHCESLTVTVGCATTTRVSAGASGATGTSAFSSMGDTGNRGSVGGRCCSNVGGGDGGDESMDVMTDEKAAASMLDLVDGVTGATEDIFRGDQCGSSWRWNLFGHLKRWVPRLFVPFL
jgi:hypothetical protein